MPDAETLAIWHQLSTGSPSQRARMHATAIEDVRALYRTVRAYRTMEMMGGKKKERTGEDFFCTPKPSHTAHTHARTPYKGSLNQLFAGLFCRGAFFAGPVAHWHEKQGSFRM